MKKPINERTCCGVSGTPCMYPSYIGFTSFQEKSIYAKLPCVAKKSPSSSGRRCKSLQNEAKKTSRNRRIKFGNGDAIKFLPEMRPLADIARKFLLETDRFYISLIYV